MKLSSILGWAALAFGALWAFNKYNAVKLLQIGFKSLNFNTVNSGSVTLSLTNPSNQDLSIQSVQGSIVDSNNVQYATVVNTVPVTIPANGEIDYPVNFYLALSQAIQSVLSVLTSDNLPALKFVGSVMFEGFTIPVNQQLPV